MNSGGFEKGAPIKQRLPKLPKAKEPHRSAEEKIYSKGEMRKLCEEFAIYALRDYVINRRDWVPILFDQWWNRPSKNI